MPRVELVVRTGEVRAFSGEAALPPSESVEAIKEFAGDPSTKDYLHFYPKIFSNFLCLLVNCIFVILDKIILILLAFKFKFKGCFFLPNFE